MKCSLCGRPFEEYTKSWKGWSVDFKRLTVLGPNEICVQVPTREAMLFQTLLLGQGEVVQRERIVTIIWGYEQPLRPYNEISVLLNRLKRKLSKYGIRFINVVCSGWYIAYDERNQ